MRDPKIPHDDYVAGYKVGWQAIYGESIPVPPTPPAPTIALLGFTPFLTGIRQAIEDATGINL